MRIDTGFLGRLGISLKTSSPEPGDQSFKLAPSVNFIMPLGAPVHPSGNILVNDFGAGFVSNNILNAGATTTILLSLPPGVWDVDIMFITATDFTNVAAGSEVFMVGPGGTEIKIIHHVQFINQVQNSHFHNVLYIVENTDFVVRNQGSAAAQNSMVEATMIAQRLL